MLSNLSSLGYKEMTPVQAESLEHILKNNDVLAQASTGSGKTAAGKETAKSQGCGYQRKFYK